MERIRRVMERDPYEGLFGRNDARESIRAHFDQLEENLKDNGRGWWGKRLRPFTWWNDSAEVDWKQMRRPSEDDSDSKPQSISPTSSASQQSPEAKIQKEQRSSNASIGSLNPAPLAEESVFDPITMRRVPKNSIPTSATTTKTVDKDTTVNILVKTFTPASSSNTKDLKVIGATKSSVSGEKWLRDSGFLQDRMQTIKDTTLTTSKPVKSEPPATDTAGSPNVQVTSSSPATAPTSKPSLAALIQQARSGSVHPAPAARASNNEADLSNRNLHAKKALEASWIKDRETRTKIQTITEAHFSHGLASNDGLAETVCYISNHRRNWPLKHMDAHALGSHRKMLLDSWARRQKQRPKSETPADKLLIAEVEKQKAAMQAFETEPRSFGPLGTDSSPTAAAVQTSVHAAAAVKSPAEILAEQHKAEERALVNEIKEIYEKAYGAIRAGTQTDGLKRCLHEYERDLPPGNYDFMMGQDNLEQELKRKGNSEEPRTTLKSGYEEPTYYDKQMGPAAYTFKMGQDNLEQELKDNAKRIEAPEATSESATSQQSPGITKQQSTEPTSPSSAPVPSQQPSTTPSQPQPGPSSEQAPKKKQEGLREILGRIRAKAPPAPTTPSATPTRQSVPAPVQDAVRLGDLEPLATLRPSTFGASTTSAAASARELTAGSGASASDTQLYAILAYDRADDLVHAASATSSFTPPTGERILSVGDALTRLHAPAKFISPLANLQSKGYDIVSANRKLLVLKRTRSADSNALLEEPSAKESALGSTVTKKISEPHVEESPSSPLTNPVDGMTSPIYTHAPSVGSFALGTGSFASPPPHFQEGTIAPGYISASDVTATDTKINSASMEASTNGSRNGQRVRKEEPVFSGTRSRRATASTSSFPVASSASGGNGDGNHNAPEADAMSSSEGNGKAFFSAVGILALGFALLYGTGAVVEGMRSLNGPDGPGGPSSGSSNAGKRTHATFAPGATDRAMWSAVPPATSSDDSEAHRRRQKAAEATAAAQKKKEEEAQAKLKAIAAANAAQKRKEERAKEMDVWEKMRAGWFDFDDSVEAAAATGARKDLQGKEASVVAGAFGTALCVASLVALLVGFPGSGL